MTGRTSAKFGARAQAVWFALVFFMLGLAVTSVLWQVQTDRERVHADREVGLIRDVIVGNIMERLNAQFVALGRIARRWEINPPTREAWEADVSQYIRDYTNMQAIEWVDPSFHVRWVVPLEGNEEAIGLNLGFEQRRREALEEAQRERVLKTSHAVDLVQGGKGFLVYSPIYRGDTFGGFILGVFRVQEFLNELTLEVRQFGYLVTVYAGAEEIYNSTQNESWNEAAWEYEATIELPGTVWELRIQPGPEVLADLGRSFPVAIPLGGVLLSILLAYAAFLARTERLQAFSLKRLNRALEERIAQSKEAEAQLHLIIESTLHGLVMVSPSGKIVLVNSQAEAMFGYARDEMLGLPIEMLVPTSFRDRHADHREAFVTDPQTRMMGQGWDLTGLRKDGSEFPVEIGLNPIMVKNELRVLSAITDITERKRSEERIKENEARYRSLTNAIPDALFVLDRQGVYQDYIPADSVETYVSPDVFLGKKAYDILPEGVAQQSQHYFARVLETGEAQQFEYTLTINKEIHYFEARMVPGPGEEVVCIVRDFTKRKQDEERILLYKDLIENLPIGIIIYHLEDLNDLTSFRLIGANDAASQATGIDITPFVGKTLYESFPSVYDTGLPEVYAEVIKTGEGRDLGEVTYEDENITEGVYDVKAFPLPNGKLGISFNNVTQRKKAEDEVKNLNAVLVHRIRERDLQTDELKAANKELDAFSYSVSHDLRTPLRAITGFANILVDQYASELSPKATHYLQRVQANTLQMGRLVDDLLQFSRMGRRALQTQHVKPQQIVEEALEELQAMQDGRQVDIEVGPLPPCKADPAMFKQVFVNLLSNALKYTEDREVAHIKVDSRVEEGKNVYFVADNGIGFDMRYADKLFGVFQRLHRAEDYEGTGVGLAIVQRIIQRHGGKIWAEAAPDQGATFYFHL